MSPFREVVVRARSSEGERVRVGEGGRAKEIAREREINRLALSCGGAQLWVGNFVGNSVY